MDCLFRLRGNLEVRSVYDKVFSKIWGASGGWLKIICPHRVTYYIKCLLRTESPRDHVDALLSFKYQPTISINDMLHMVAQHGNLRTSGEMFFPYKGRVADPTDENIAKVENKEAVTNFSFLENQQEFNRESIDADIFKDQESHSCHPVTVVKEKFSLYDTFHEGDTVQKTEHLRRLCAVENLQGFINSQSAEQYNRSANCCNHFLNDMSPTNHIFVFTLLTHLRNSRVNHEFIKRMKSASSLNSSTVCLDNLGRAILSQHPSSHFNSKQPYPLAQKKHR